MLAEVQLRSMDFLYPVVLVVILEFRSLGGLEVTVVIAIAVVAGAEAAHQMEEAGEAGEEPMVRALLVLLQPPALVAVVVQG
jgi:hypothetical protein